ncbi:hypothetical protein [Polluticoccus soli]|uniref:hypothetical protein n=1 Tax=Polluticoccus soli TaxID=3034150 RepID=UPI0023E1D40F|nr:hypothetical protein [Flavipsychrobacter sp. JY13-12]
MQTKFTTSINIIRDSDREINYIPTPNATRVVNQISNDFKKGIRSFNIIGSYGTGKSSFLWAYQQSITRKKRYFNVNLVSNPNYEIVNFVGEYKSITSTFADYFDVKAKKTETANVLSEIYNRYHDLGTSNPLLIITIDEFGKFLEYAAQNSPEKELYFIQQLSEFANNPKHNILLLTTVHQNFDAYAMGLSSSQKQEWTKVKGRFKEVTFNEPVEQLLYLAGEHISQNADVFKNDKLARKALDIALRSKAFTTNSEYLSEIAAKLFPLDILAASAITLSLQKYGQNERSLFSFLEATDYTGINNGDWRKNNPFYNISCVYDYLVFNFYSFVNSRYNPDYAAWSAIKNAIEEIERSFDGNILDYLKIIKSIGLLNILSANGAVLDKAFLVNYSKVCLGIAEAEELIAELEKRKIILYRNYNKRYVLFEGTDLDIQSALIEAANRVSEISDVPTLLNKHYQLPLVFAKQYSYTSGTPRFFEYKISDFPISIIPEGEIDGFINLIFNEKLSLSEVKRHSSEQKEAILYGYYKDSKTIRDLLFEIEKTKQVIDDQERANDKIAVRELNNILQHQQNLLNHKILNSFYSNSKEIAWVYNGELRDIPTKTDFNKQLSQICELVYTDAPKFNNELVNKHKISNSIHTAKKNYLRALVNNWNQPDLGFDRSKFPPEKMIYLSLIKENGIELYSDEINFTTTVSSRSSFKKLWKVSEKFLNSAKAGRRRVSDLSDILNRRPFKLKQGFIDFWLPTFLFVKRNDFALFGEYGYIPNLTDEVLELVIKYPEEYEIKAFDIEGVKLDIFNSYRLFLSQDVKQEINNLTFIETIKPFLTFFKGLPEYSKATRRLKKETLSLRDAISTSKDPEQSFFEEFPAALGFSVPKLQSSKTELQSYVNKLQESIRELRTCYDALVNRFEDYIQSEFIGEKIEFEKYKAKLQARFQKLRTHLLLPYQKTFIQRLNSSLDDKKAWLNSITQAVIGKSLDNLKDEDEVILYDKFKSLIIELDSLTNISKTDVDESKEEVFGLEITSFVDGVNKKMIRLPKNKKEQITSVETEIKKRLTKDKTTNIAALANVLKDLLRT